MTKPVVFTENRPVDKLADPIAISPLSSSETGSTVRLKMKDIDAANAPRAEDGSKWRESADHSQSAVLG